jgi:hypothetical protein
MKSFEEFQSTRQEMPLKQFGDLIGDAMWEDEPLTSRALVYDDSWFIEIVSDGRFHLMLENRSLITGPDKTLEDLERELYEFAEVYDQ